MDIKGVFRAPDAQDYKHQKIENTKDQGKKKHDKEDEKKKKKKDEKIDSIFSHLAENIGSYDEI